MNFVDTINPNPLASRNAKDIFLQDITASRVDITVAEQSSASFSFAAQPYSGQLRIRLTDILRSLKIQAFQVPPETEAGVAAVAAAKTVTISASAAGETSPAPWVRTVFDGGYERGLHTALMDDFWWTWRDQVCRTFLEGKEYLGALVQSGQESIRVTARFADGTTGQATFGAIDARSGAKFGIIDVSYTRISEIFPGKTVMSYKVYRGASSYPQAYEVSSLRPRQTFIFRNSLGLFDTVYAMGRISDGIERDVTTFIGGDRIEGISENSSREHIYVNSGRIDTSGGRTIWNEFLHSEDAWEYNSGHLRKIVVDQFDVKMQRGISASITFEYHYSEEPAGNGFTKAAI